MFKDWSVLLTRTDHLLLQRGMHPRPRNASSSWSALLNERRMCNWVLCSRRRLLSRLHSLYHHHNPLKREPLHLNRSGSHALWNCSVWLAALSEIETKEKMRKNSDCFEEVPSQERTVSVLGVSPGERKRSKELSESKPSAARVKHHHDHPP